MGVSFLTFGDKGFFRLRVSFFLGGGVRDSYVWGLVFLHLGVSFFYVWGLIFLRLGVSHSYFWGLVILTLGG